MAPEEVVRALYHDPSYAEKALATAAESGGDRCRLKNRHTTARLAWEPRFHDPFLPKWLHRIDVPVKIVWGEQDRIIPVGFTKEFTRLLPKPSCTSSRVPATCRRSRNRTNSSRSYANSPLSPDAVRRPRSRGAAQERHGG
jgi:pimeloyl-ACP methyl ester carboxylesterase